MIFAAKQRTFFTQVGQTFNVTLDGQVIGTYSPPETIVNYVDYRTSVFTVTSGSYTLAFVGTLYNNGGDNTIFLNNVRVIGDIPPQFSGIGFSTNGLYTLIVQGPIGFNYI